MKTNLDAYQLLTHAIWHCKWGSACDGRQRVPDAGDLGAVVILTKLKDHILRDMQQKEITGL